MTQVNRFARRSFLKGAGLGVGAGFLGGAVPPIALAQGAPPGDAAIWSNEYWAKKGGVALNLFRKRVGAAVAGEKPLPILFLVHGSSISARPSFDLTVPGLGPYSLMDAFARYGFDVWTMDHENYGRSARTEGNSDIASGAEDLKAAAQVVARETGQPRLNMLGTSSGALRAGAYAMVEPERVDRLVLSAFTYTGEGSPTLGNRAKQVEFYKTHNKRPRDRAMILSIFTRDKPGTSEPGVGEALAEAELKFGDSVPTGTYLDMTANLPVVDPAKVKAPVLLVRGEHDGIATVDDLVSFYKKLPNGDRQLVILPGAAHTLTLARNRHLFWHAVRAFLTLPKAEQA